VFERNKRKGQRSHYYESGKGILLSPMDIFDRIQPVMITPEKRVTAWARTCLFLACGALGWTGLRAASALHPQDVVSSGGSGGSGSIWSIGPEPVFPPIIIDPIWPINPGGPMVPTNPTIWTVWPGQISPYFSTSIFTWTDGNQYGVATMGGASDSSEGAVFEQTPDGNTTTLYSFDADSSGNYTNGSNPFVLLPDANGFFYGATSNGGVDNYGTIFELSPDGGNFSSLVSFDSVTDGAAPNCLILAGDTNFYGTTSTGGAAGNGTVFQMTPAGVLTTVYAFSGDANGGNPTGIGQGGDGNLYGSTTLGGTNGTGTIFTVTPGGALTTLADFPAQAGFADGTGTLPYSATSTLTAADGTVYGVTMFTGNYDDSEGSVFSLTPDGTVTTLFSFDADDNGNYPDGSDPFVLLQGPDGNLYGATSGDGPGGYGTIFELGTDGSGFTTLVSFDSTDNGAYPNTLILGSDGNFYGTTSNGGPTDSGTVFEMTPDGTLTTLFTFSGDANGSYPVNLMQGVDGNLYGVTAGGGANGSGTLFQLTPDGTLNTLMSFESGGSFGFLPLVNTIGAAVGPKAGGAAGGKGPSAHGAKGSHKPVVTCLVIGGGKKLAFRSSLLLHGLATGTGGVKKVEYSINGGSFKPATGTKRWTVPVSLKKGKNTVVVRVTNSQGQQTTQTITVNRRR